MLVHTALAAQEIFLDGFELCRTAGVIEWDGGGDGTSWSDAANWVGDAVPPDGAKVAIRENTSLTVDIGAGQTVTLTCLAVSSNLSVSWGNLVLDGAATIIGDLVFTRGTMTVGTQTIVRGDFEQQPLANVDGTGTLTVDGLFTWTGGTHGGAGRTIANGGVLIDGANTKSLNERTLTINGAGSWSGSGQIWTRSGPTIHINAPFDIATDADTDISFGTAPQLVINSTLTKSAGSGQTIIEMPFQNNGEIVVDAGQLDIGYINAGGSSSGSFDIAAGSTLTVVGSHNFSVASSIGGAGDFDYVGGTGVFEGSLPLTGTWTLSYGTAEFPSGASMQGNVEIPGLVSNPQLVAEGAFDIAGTLLLGPGTVLTGGGTITIGGLFTWTGGTQLGSGETIANGGMQISGANTKGCRERTLILNGASQWTGTGNLDARTGATIEVNAPFDIATDADITHIQFADPVMNIADSLRKTAGAAVTQIAMVVTNSGSVAVESGALQFLKTYTQDASGSLAVGIAGDADFDAYAVTGVATLGGTLDISLLNSYEPALGTSFEILTASSRSGTFDTVNGTAIAAGRRFDVIYGANNVTLTVVAE